MSATDELRQMLDERGVEWTSGSTEVSRSKYTHFCPDAGMSMGLWESGDGKLGIDAHTNYRFTPAQAIAATLGPKTCHNESEYPQMFFICSECGCAHKRNRAYVDMPRYCPNCGAKVVEG